MKSTNVAIYGDRPPTRCGWCLKPAWSGNDTCRECRSVELNARRGYTENDALTGGLWVSRGGIQVWMGPRPTNDDWATQRLPAKCGTDSGYRRHHRLDEPTCDPCKAAHSAAERRRTAA